MLSIPGPYLQYPRNPEILRLPLGVLILWSILPSNKNKLIVLIDFPLDYHTLLENTPQILKSIHSLMKLLYFFMLSQSENGTTVKC